MILLNHKNELRLEIYAPCLSLVLADIFIFWYGRLKQLVLPTVNLLKNVVLT